MIVKKYVFISSRKDKSNALNDSIPVTWNYSQTYLKKYLSNLLGCWVQI